MDVSASDLRAGMWIKVTNPNGKLNSTRALPDPLVLKIDNVGSSHVRSGDYWIPIASIDEVSDVRMSASASRAVTMAIAGQFVDCPCGASCKLDGAGKCMYHTDPSTGKTCDHVGADGTGYAVSRRQYTAAQMARAIAGATKMAWGDDKFTGNVVECPVCGNPTVKVTGISPKLSPHSDMNGKPCKASGKYVTEFARQFAAAIHSASKMGGAVAMSATDKGGRVLVVGDWVLGVGGFAIEGKITKIEGDGPSAMLTVDLGTRTDRELAMNVEKTY